MLHHNHNHISAPHGRGRGRQPSWSYGPPAPSSDFRPGANAFPNNNGYGARNQRRDSIPGPVYIHNDDHPQIQHSFRPDLPYHPFQHEQHANIYGHQEQNSRPQNNHHYLPNPIQTMSGPVHPAYAGAPTSISPTESLIFPEIIDSLSLYQAVQTDVERVYRSMKANNDDRHDLQRQVASLKKDNLSLRQDYANALQNFEKQRQIWLDKQFLFWKLLERVKGGVQLGHVFRSEADKAGGEWVPNDPTYVEAEGITAADVDKMWSRPYSQSESFTASDTINEVEAEVEERGRSRVRVLQTPNTTAGGRKSSWTEVSRGGTASISDTSETPMKLDPNATPFIPSPARSMQRASTDSVASSTYKDALQTSRFKSKMLPAPTVATPLPPLRRHSQSLPPTKKEERKSDSTIGGSSQTESIPDDARTNSPQFVPTGTTSPDNPWTLVKSAKKEAQLIQAMKRDNGNGGKKKKSKQMGDGPGKMPEQGGLRPSTTQSQLPKHGGHPERNKLELTSRHGEQDNDMQDRKVSPNIERITKLPAYPSLNQPKHTESNTPIRKRVSSIEMKKDSLASGPSVLQLPRKNDDEISKIQIPFMSKARLQATLNSISEPYNSICPNSLLGKDCTLDNCDLDHLCPIYNNPLSRSVLTGNIDDDADFPALGSPLAEKVELCKTREGKPVKEGGICETGGIHLYRTCEEELSGKQCHWWRSNPAMGPSSGSGSGSGTSSNSHGSRKFRALSLEHNYIASPMFTSGPSQTQTGVPTQLQRTEGNNQKKGKQASDRGQHFKHYIHERDGVGQNIWNARMMNAKLKDMHERGLWGVSGTTVEDGQEVIERKLESREHFWGGKKQRSRDNSLERLTPSEWRASVEEKRVDRTPVDWRIRGAWNGWGGTASGRQYKPTTYIRDELD